MAISEFEILEHLEHDLRGTAPSGYARNLLHSRSKTAIKEFFAQRTRQMEPERLRTINILLNHVLHPRLRPATLEKKLDAYADSVRQHLETIRDSSTAIGTHMEKVQTLSGQLRDAHEEGDAEKTASIQAEVGHALPSLVKSLEEHGEYLHNSAEILKARIRELRRMNRHLSTPAELAEARKLLHLIDTEATNSRLGAGHFNTQLRKDIYQLELRKHPLNKALEQLEWAETHARRMSETIRDVLSPHLHVFSTERISEELAELRRIPDLKTVMVSLPDKLPSGMIRGRRILIRRLFKNILVNAAQHGAKKIQVGATTHVGKNGERHIRFTIYNDGKPIPADILPQLGTKFATFREGGTGLGIHFASTVVAYHGGTWHPPQSDGKKGATFSFTLPIIAAAKGTVPSPKPLQRTRPRRRPR